MRQKKSLRCSGYGYQAAGNNSAKSYVFEPGFSIRPFSMLKIGVTATYQENTDELQYVETKELSSEFGTRYVLGTIDQTTLGLTFRADLNLTPEFSIQYYGSPFISKGAYKELKRVTNPEAEDYEDRFAIYENPVLVDDSYLLYDFDSGSVPAIYSVENPDFNFHQFRSNLVAKWEYRLGSFIYFVWSSERTGNNGSSDASIGDSFRFLRDVYPNNIFLIKLNYWFSL